MRSKYVLLFVSLVFSCTAGSRVSLHAQDSDLYNGRLYGIYEPLKVEQTESRIVVSGGTFTYRIDRATGQVVSAEVLGDEFLAAGSSFPNPYVGLIPESDPGALRVGGSDRKRFSFEKAIEMRPKLWSGGLTGAFRLDAVKSTGIKTELVSVDMETALVRATGKYVMPETGQPTPLSWEIAYFFEVDGFTKVTVQLKTEIPVKLRWHCFNHAFFSKQAVDFISRYPDLGAPPFDLRPAPTEQIGRLGPDEPVMESHWNPVFHLGNPLTGIEFSKEEFAGRLSGYRDSRVQLENGLQIHTGTVETAEGDMLRSYDSRGKRGMFTQLYMRDNRLELEEFDIRNTTCPLNPGEVREHTFFVQLTPPKLPRDDLNSTRIFWPGPHQVQMARWRGMTEPWSPPSDEIVQHWAKIGINLVVGGANYFSGDYSHPTFPEKIRRFIDTAHKYGIKVIPYVTFSDWNFEAPGYQEHAADWMSSKSIEYAGHTTLMCFGAEGWREHVERECDALLSQFDFDGLYVDHWFMTRHCNNPRHGCGGYLGRFVTEGYHDFAKRLRRVVARHTDGTGIMLINSNNLISSTNLSWFDIRLLGENNNPLVLPGETIMSTWNGKRQGVQSAIMWRENQDAVDMLNFCATFGFSFRLRRNRGNPQFFENWVDADPADPESELGFNRKYWELLRFFDVNRARRFSAFDSREVISLSQPGSQITAFARDSRLMVHLGFLMTQESSSQDRSARPERSEILTIHQPEKLGLTSGARYRVIDLMGNRYLDRRTYSLEELKNVPVTLTLGVARIFMIAPDEEKPHLAWFRGADRVEAEIAGDKMTLRITSAAGSPIALHLDAGGEEFRCLTPGIKMLPADGDFTVFTGTLPEDKTVVLARTK
jgi:Domain of unknown function (DUF6259)